ncbi:MAG: TatD family hydrolase [Lactobacillaceae bacterium]|jgi:TatD DNase family protein|nr:TatD family hydrolase [Lactobacillaceae bacterium]
MVLYDPTKIPGDVYDTHTHLNDDSMFHDVAAYIGRANEYRVMQMNVVGYDLQGNQRAIEIAEQNENVYAIVGWQPDSTNEFDDEKLDILKEQIKNPNVVGIGETGLDYHFEGFNKNKQIDSFEKHLQLAKDNNLPVTIHMRDAFEDVYSILKKFDIHEFIMHSFGGDQKQAQKLLELGGYISFSGMVTFKKANNIQEAAKIVPLNKMLVETDAPYLAPVPYRGKMNEPAYTRFVVDGLSEILNIKRDELAKITTKNAQTLWNTSK